MCLGSPCSAMDFFFRLCQKDKKRKKGPYVCVEYVEALGSCCCHDWAVCVKAFKGV